MAGQGAGMSRTGPPSEPPRDYAGLFAVERDRLTELLASLQAPDWERPSPCPGWAVLGLCCHLVGDDLGLLARNRDGFLGTPPPSGPRRSSWPGWMSCRPNGSGPRLAGSLAMNAEQAWRLLTNNMPAAGQADLTVSGDDAITAILLRTRAIIGVPKWA
jgi:hypothetical protein